MPCICGSGAAIVALFLRCAAKAVSRQLVTIVPSSVHVRAMARTVETRSDTVPSTQRTTGRFCGSWADDTEAASRR